MIYFLAKLSDFFVTYTCLPLEVLWHCIYNIKDQLCNPHLRPLQSYYYELRIMCI